MDSIARKRSPTSAIPLRLGAGLAAALIAVIALSAIVYAAAPPKKPTGLDAVPGDGSVTLSWNNPKDGSITQWLVQYRLVGKGNGGWGRITAIPGSNASTASHTVAGLTNGKEYRFRVYAENAGGRSARSKFAEATPGSGPKAPELLEILEPTPTAEAQAQTQGTAIPNDPSNATVSAGDVEALITWTSGADGSCASNEFVVVIYLGDSDDVVVESAYIKDPDNGEPWHRWHVDDLTPATRYTAVVDAYGSSCDNWSNGSAEASFTTAAATQSGDPTAPNGNTKRAPHKVKNLNVTASGTSATATWSPANAGGGAKRCASANPQEYFYYLENVTTDTTDAQGAAAEASPTVTFSNLTSGSSYYVIVENYSPECDAWSTQAIYDWTQP